MKRLLVLLAVVLMLSTAVSASAEGVSMDLFSLIRGQLFEFSSGVGAWSTEDIRMVRCTDARSMVSSLTRSPWMSTPGKQKSR